MAVKAVTHYRTKNREALLAYLRSREGEHVTVSEIHDHFRQTGSSMGVATIYRQLEQLVSEGQMRKYVVESSSAACFEYIGARQGCARFIHCKCGKCGKILHIDQSEIQEMTRLLEERSGFTDMAEEYGAEQVLYAHCHGEARFHDSIQGVFRGVRYSLVSGDYLKWIPRKVLD